MLTEFFTKFSLCLINFKKIISNFFLAYQYLYIIESIDIKTHDVIIRCRGRSIIVKTTFEKIISDQDVINKLPPIQSCALGGYYGKELKISQKRQDLLKGNTISFLVKASNDKYKVISVNRDRSIKYIDQETNMEYIDYPINIARNDNIISKFNSSQACYIGILAGIGLDKLQDEYSYYEDNKSVPYLRLVK